MNIISFIKNNVIQLSIILVLIIVIIFLLTIDNFTDTDNFSIPPHIEELDHEQMIPQNKPLELQKPESEIKEPVGIAPDYNKTNERITKENISMVPSNMYRLKTGREGIEQERFVSIYDSNFGGLLGTTLGTSNN